MAIDTTPEGLANELRRSRELLDNYLGEPYRESIRRLCGPAYRINDGPTDVDFENHAHAWQSIFLPMLASGNPRVRGRTPRLGPAAALAKATEFAVNRNFELTNVKKTIEQLATDWSFRYCAAITTPLPVLGLKEREDPPHRPTTRRLSLEDYVWDSLATSHAEARFQGHRVVRDKSSLLEEAEAHPERGWNVPTIQALAEDQARKKQRQRMQAGIQRGEVEFFELWIPEITLEEATGAQGAFQPTEEEGFHGTIFTVNQDAREFVRAPRPYWGPRDGAYTFDGYLYVPDQVVPLSPLVATAAQQEILNAVMASAVAAIKAYKKGLGISSAAPGLEEKIATFLDQGILTVDGIEELEKVVKEIEVGGLTQQHLLMLQQLRFLADKQSGMTEAAQGQISGDATATEASIAQMSSGRRMGYMTEKFNRGVTHRIAKKEAWFLTMDPRSRTMLGDLAQGIFMDPKTGQPIEMPVLVGGPEHGDLLEDFDIEIDPISMRFTTEMLEAERSASWEQFLLATAPIIPQLPYVDWGLVYARKAEQLGDPALARTIDIQKAMMMGQIQLMATMGMLGPAMVAQPTSTQPRLGIDMPKPKPAGPPALKGSERPSGFTSNARPGGSAAGQRGQVRKGPRMAGASSSTK